MESPKCRHENPEGAKFCVECGEKLEKKCQKCGFSNSRSFKFCAECGNALLESGVAPPIDIKEPQ